MESCITRQPIFDLNNEVYGYELMYRESIDKASTGDSAVANTITKIFTEMCAEDILDDKIAFITFTPTMIMKKIASLFDKEKLVIQISDDMTINPFNYKMICNIRELGYKIALNVIEYSPRFIDLLNIADMVKVNMSIVDESTLMNIEKICNGMNKKIIATNVNDKQTLEYAKSNNVGYMQGVYFSKPVILPSRVLKAIQGNFYSLIIEVTKEEPDIDDVVKIIERDVVITYKLMKLINSSYYSLKSKVSSVKQGVIIIGIQQLKEWVYLLSFEQNKDTPPEVVKLSFLRGSFARALCEYIPNYAHMKSEFYLMGMLSTLDVLLNTNLPNALNDLSINDEIKNGLIYHDGVAGILYNLILAYEVGEWSGISQFANALKIPQNIITTKYFECVEEVNAIWQSLNSNPDAN